MTTAERLDAALEHLKAIGHSHEASAEVRRHIEFASAHIRECPGCPWDPARGTIFGDAA